MKLKPAYKTNAALFPFLCVLLAAFHGSLSVMLGYFICLQAVSIGHGELGHLYHRTPETLAA